MPSPEFNQKYFRNMDVIAACAGFGPLPKYEEVEIEMACCEACGREMEASLIKPDMICYDCIRKGG